MPSDELLCSDTRLFLLERLRQIVGRRHTLTGDAQTREFRVGFRFGEGRCLAVVRPACLVQQWDVAKACVEAGVIIIMQAANTGLTGGSTPDGSDYDRPVVIVNTKRMNRLRLIDKGRQVICFPGTTLNQIERALLPLGREPHSVIGSSCVGASVFGGICNNSGGALVARGPAYTQMSIYAQVNGSGELSLHNHLGVTLGDDPRNILDRLDRDDFDDSDILFEADRSGSDRAYAKQVRMIDADTPARYNADPRLLFEASGSAGRLILFALRLDTFPKSDRTGVFYVGVNDSAVLANLRRHALINFQSLPVSGEYLHRDAFDMAMRYGKDTFLAIEMLGTRRLSTFFAIKTWFDKHTRQIKWAPRNFSDKLLQFVSRILPRHLPHRILGFRDRFVHHLILTMAGDGVDEARSYLRSLARSGDADFIECTVKEAKKVALHRFAVAGAAVRFRAVHEDRVEDIVSLDVALRRNDRDWFEILPAEIEPALMHKIYYGHFFCNVFHQDYIVARGYSASEIERAMWKLLDGRGAQYPAEHNVGHIYSAAPSLREFYHRLDPTNTLNPGIGRTSKRKHWR